MAEEPLEAVKRMSNIEGPFSLLRFDICCSTFDISFFRQTEKRDLGTEQVAVLPDLKAFQRAWSNARPDKFEHFQPHSLQQATHFAIFPLGKHDLQPTIFAAILHPADALRLSPIASFQLNPFRQSGYHLAAD